VLARQDRGDRAPGRRAQRRGDRARRRGLRLQQRRGELRRAQRHHDPARDGGRLLRRIERVDLATGKVERLYDACGEYKLRAPNDLVFDQTGGIWFTDFGCDPGRQRDKSGIYHAASDGSKIVEVYFGGTGYNGIGLSPDDKIVYAAETFTGRLVAFDVTGPGEIARRRGGRFPGRVVATRSGEPLEYFDSLAVTAAGNVCVATLLAPGITTIAPDGRCTKRDTDDLFTTNLCFGGHDMCDAWLTLSGTGKLGKTRWHEPGLRLHFNA
jgi:gluconolactonase